MNNLEVCQSGLDLHIYARTVPDLIAGSDRKQEVCSPYIYTRTKPNLFLVVKIWIVAVSLSFLYNHTLVHEKRVQRHKDITPTLVADACIALLQRLYDVGIACTVRFPKPFSNAVRCCCSVSSVSGNFFPAWAAGIHSRLRLRAMRCR